MSKTSLLVTTAIVAAGLSAPSFAANSHSTTAVKMPPQHVVVPSKKGPIRATVLNTTSVYGTIAASTFTAVATQTVAARVGSTLSMSAMMQYCGFSGEFAPTATDIITEVDATYVDGGPYQAGVPSTDICIADNWQGIFPISTAGTYTVTYNAYAVGSSVYVGRITERTDVVN